jgi:integrase
MEKIMEKIMPPGVTDRSISVLEIMIVRRPGGTRDLSQAWIDAVDGWLTWLRVGGKRPATVRLRGDHVRMIARRSKAAQPSDVTLNNLVMICSAQSWSNEHRKGVRVSLISFFDYCMNMQITAHNPAAQLPKVPPSTPRPRPAPDDVWFDLTEAAPPRERLMALLAGEAGLRRAEVAVVHVNDMIRDMAGWSLIVHGKGGRQRVVPLTERLAAEVRQFGAHGYLFPGQIDGHISPAWVGVIISELMPDGWTMHKLRHRFASRGYAGTRNLRAVQEALGHASVATTQLYTAVSNDEIRSVASAAANGHGAGNRPSRDALKPNH